MTRINPRKQSGEQWRKLRFHTRVRARLEAIERNWPALPQAPTMPERLPLTIAEFCRANEDGRGTTVAALQDVERTLKHIKSAVRQATVRVRSAAGLVRRARKLLKALQHNTSFELTVEQAHRYAGEAQKAGKRAARAWPVCIPEEHHCGKFSRVGRVRLRRVISVTDLMKVGRTLGLCVARADTVGRRYHSKLRDEEAEFWTLTTPAGPIALLSLQEVEGKRVVMEIQGRDGGQPLAVDCNGVSRPLSGSVLRNVLRSLDADTSEDEFTRVGAFRSLLGAAARASGRDVVAEGRRYRVWRFADEVIVGLLRGRRGETVETWSRFVRSETLSMSPRPRYEWERGAWHEDAMDTDRFLELLAESPEMYDAFRNPRA